MPYFTTFYSNYHTPKIPHIFTGKFLLAVIAITIATTCIQWFFTGFLFHKYQADTPATWRKESNRSYTLSTLIALIFSFMFVVMFHFCAISFDGKIDYFGGLFISTVCWLTFSVPAELGNAVYVNYSRMFVLGKCTSSLVEYIVAGVLAVAIL